MTIHDLKAIWVFECGFPLSKDLDDSLFNLMTSEDPVNCFEIRGRLFICANGVAIKTGKGWTAITRHGRTMRSVYGLDKIEKNSIKMIDL